MTECQLMRIEKKAMITALHRELHFFGYVVAISAATQYSLSKRTWWISCLNSSEKRLARFYCYSRTFGKDGVPEDVVPKISQETLAEMVGTTRSRVSFFS